MLYKTTRIVILAISSLLLAACSSGVFSTPTPSPTPIPSPTFSPALLVTSIPTSEVTPVPIAPLDAFFAIQPGQTSLEEVVTLLGEPGEIGEIAGLFHLEYPALSLTVHFHKESLLVYRVLFYDESFTITDLIAQLGMPEITYQVDISEDRIGWFARVFFAYPEQGMFAYVTSPRPQLTDVVEVFYRERPQSIEDHLKNISESTSFRIIEWP